MIKKAYKIDKESFYTEDCIYEEGQELESNIIITEMQQGFYKPKWDGSAWIEGDTQEYIDSINALATPQPTETELLKVQLLETQATLASLQEQILLSNGGI